MAREFVMLGHLMPEGTKPRTGWFYSEKLDGQRALWTGIPYSETDRFSGLLSRYGQPIFAPPSWLEALPIGIPLDGELWLSRKSFQTLRTIVAGNREKVEADPRWSEVKFKVFDSPPYHRILAPGLIRGPSRTTFSLLATPPTYDRRGPNDLGISAIQEIIQKETVEQHQIKADTDITSILTEISSLGGEGLMLRSPILTWEPARTKLLLKLKPRSIAHGVVKAYIAGKGKYLGMVGSVTVQYTSITVDISGFTDDERRHIGTLFPIGSSIQFSYRELSDSGVPKEAQYLRRDK